MQHHPHDPPLVSLIFVWGFVIHLQFWENCCFLPRCRWSRFGLSGRLVLGGVAAVGDVPSRWLAAGLEVQNWHVHQFVMMSQRSQYERCGYRYIESRNNQDNCNTITSNKQVTVQARPQIDRMFGLYTGRRAMACLIVAMPVQLRRCVW
jgi:hypothetical protein